MGEASESVNKYRRLWWLPWAMVLLRLALGPILLVDATDGETGFGFVVGLALAVGSDIADGLIAGRLGLITPNLRKADSLVDFMVLVMVGAAAWVAHRAVLEAHAALIIATLALAALAGIPAFVRFRRAPSYHAYSAKASGLAFFAAGVQLFGQGTGGLLLDVALLVSMLSHLDRLAISLLLPAWQTDVTGFWEASKLRREKLSA